MPRSRLGAWDAAPPRAVLCGAHGHGSPRAARAMAPAYWRDRLCLAIEIAGESSRPGENAATARPRARPRGDARVPSTISWIRVRRGRPRSCRARSRPRCAPATSSAAKAASVHAVARRELVAPVALQRHAVTRGCCAPPLGILRLSSTSGASGRRPSGALVLAVWTADTAARVQLFRRDRSSARCRRFSVDVELASALLLIRVSCIRSRPSRPRARATPSVTLETLTMTAGDASIASIATLARRAQTPTATLVGAFITIRCAS